MFSTRYVLCNILHAMIYILSLSLVLLLSGIWFLSFELAFFNEIWTISFGWIFQFNEYILCYFCHGCDIFLNLLNIFLYRKKIETWRSWKRYWSPKSTKPQWPSLAKNSAWKVWNANIMIWKSTTYMFWSVWQPPICLDQFKDSSRPWLIAWSWFILLKINE